MRISSLSSSPNNALKITISASNIFFSHFYVFLIIFLCGAFSIVNIPLLPQDLWLPLVLPCTMTALIYFPKVILFPLIFVGLWMDHILMFSSGIHAVFMVLTLISIRTLENFSKQHTFLSRWGLFFFSTLLYFVVMTVFSDYFMNKNMYFSFFLTIFSFPLFLGVFRYLLSPAMRLVPKRP